MSTKTVFNTKAYTKIKCELWYKCFDCTVQNKNKNVILFHVNIFTKEIDTSALAQFDFDLHKTWTVHGQTWINSSHSVAQRMNILSPKKACFWKFGTRIHIQTIHRQYDDSTVISVVSSYNSKSRSSFYCCFCCYFSLSCVFTCSVVMYVFSVRCLLFK